MSIKVTFNGATIIKPGAYSKIVVENLSGFPLQPTGVCGIVGEAVGGEPNVLDILDLGGIQDAKARYKSGPIADALGLLTEPSKDPRIPNGANKIIVYKTNHGLQSSLNLKNSALSPVNQVLLTSKNWGGDENNLSAAVSVGSIVDANAAIVGSIAGPFVLSGGETLILIVNNVTYTFTGTLVGSTAASALVTELNTVARWSSSLKPVIASQSSGFITITLDTAVVTAGAKDYGYIHVNPASTLDTIVGIVGDNRGKKGSRFITFKKSTQTETTLELGGVDVMSILYTGAGTAAVLSIQKSLGAIVLTSTITGAPADNLNMTLKDAAGAEKFTIQSLVDQINATGVYTAAVLFPTPSINASELDFYLNLDIRNVAAVLRRDINDMVEFVSTFSQLANASRIDNVVGDIATFASPVFFTGAADGASANSDFANGFEAFKSVRINNVIPLISQDTGPLSIDSINALADAHAQFGWSTLGKSERQAYVSKLASKANLKIAAKNLNSGFTQIVGQQVTVLDRTGTLRTLDPWAFACILAGLRSGAETGEPLTSKFINVNNVIVQDGSWDPKKDFAEMLDAGVTIAEPVDSGGFRVVLDNTTYGIDPSFVYNRGSVVDAAGFIAYDLRFNLELVFVGTKARTGTAEAIANFIKARMSTYLDNDIIVGDDDNKGLGFKNLSVSIQGNTAIIKISVTPVQGIDFILPTIYLADIRQSA